jgi:uncharacterized membrane protein YhaH (DUF805 family)
MYTLLVVIVSVVLYFIDSAMGFGQSATAPGLGPLRGIFILATLIPGLAVTVRRLHDTNRSGWWVLIALVPLVGGIVLLVWVCTDGTAGPNDYGDDPKADTPAELARTFE